MNIHYFGSLFPNQFFTHLPTICSHIYGLIYSLTLFWQNALWFTFGFAVGFGFQSWCMKYEYLIAFAETSEYDWNSNQSPRAMIILSQILAQIEWNSSKSHVQSEFFTKCDIFHVFLNQLPSQTKHFASSSRYRVSNQNEKKERQKSFDSNHMMWFISIGNIHKQIFLMGKREESEKKEEKGRKEKHSEEMLEQ